MSFHIEQAQSLQSAGHSNRVAHASSGCEAGTLALTIAEIANRHTRLSHLTAELAELLRAELGGDTAAFFWRRQHEHPKRGVRPALQAVATATAQPSDAVPAMRSLKANAYRAISQGQLIARINGLGEPHEQHPLTHVLALPIGTSVPWAVLAVGWHAPSVAVEEEYAPLLKLLAPSLAAATRPAHVLDEVAHGEHINSPRRAIFAVSSEAIATVGDDFTIHEVNPAFGKVTGWVDRHPIGLRCSEVIRCRDERKKVLCDTPRCPLREAFSSDGPTPVRDLNWETRNGKLAEVSAAFTAERAAGDTRAIIVARDATLLNATNRMRANFISMVSHELRTPLNSINGFLDIVLDGQVGPLNERQLEFLGYAHTSTQQLTTLVEDILIISKADSGQFTLRLEPVHIGQIVEQVLQTLHTVIEQADIRVCRAIPSDLPPLRADALRLQQVLANLLNNALKFSPPHSTVVITAEQCQGEIRISVADQGKGVAPQDSARIFERFYQSETNARSRAGGYGLGLAIAKLIIEQHSGRIWVESQPGLGATFLFTLPLA